MRSIAVKITIVGKSDLTGMLLRQTSPSGAAKALRPSTSARGGSFTNRAGHLISVARTHCGNFMIFLSLIFYVKSLLGIVEVQNVPF